MDMRAISVFPIVITICACLVLFGCSASKAEGHLEAGDKLRQQDLFDNAIAEYDEALRLDPQDTQAYAYRALAYSRLGKDGEARQDVDRAVGLGYDRALLEGTIEELKTQP